MPPVASKMSAGRVGEAATLAVAYFTCAAITLQLTRFDGGFAIVWPAGAVLLARLSATPRRRWWPLVAACVPAGLAASTLFGFRSWVAAPLIGIGVAEAAAAAWLLKRFCPRFGRFRSLTEAARFLAVAGLLVPATGASLAAWCAHMAVGIPYWSGWRDWYAGHALGFVVFAPPLLLTLRGEARRQFRTAGRGNAVQAAALLGAVALGAAVTFGQNRVPLVMLPFVPMVAATFRLGRFGAVASVIMLVGIGFGCSLAGLGPTTLLHGGMGLKLQVLQIYFATAVLILLPVAAELTARQRLLNRLRAAESLHRLILDRTGDVVLRLGLDGTVRYASPFVERVWGYSPDRVVGRSVLDLPFADDVPQILDARRRLLAHPEETVTAEYRIRRADGDIIWVESHMRATLDETGQPTGTVSIVREVTERRRVVEDLARKATTDPLTGLSNRRAFDEALAARFAAGGRERGGCVAVFDLDHFKRINDRHGHATGDAVLVRFAALLRASVRDGDVVARLGGEEFAVLLAGATVEQARQVCERIRARLAESEQRSGAGERFRATVSAGLAPLSAGEAAKLVVAAADAALYRAKEAGRDRLALAA